MPRTSIFLLCALALLGCHGTEPPPEPTDAGTKDAGPACALPFVGDASKALEVELIALGPDFKPAPVLDGGALTLIEPTQGGQVVFVGVRATNIDPCEVQLAGALRDPTKAVTIDQRTVNLTPTGDGWAQSNDVATFTNIPACPNEWSSTTIYGNPYEVVMTVTDHAKVRTATITRTVVPACSEADAGDAVALCNCICRAGYVLGEPCDGGSPEAGP